MKTVMKLKKGIFCYLIVLTVLTFSSCSKDNDAVNTFSVKVLRQGQKCQLIQNEVGVWDYLIEFNENVTDLPFENKRIYYASNLPEDLKIEDLEIDITYRILNLEDGHIYCDTAMGGDEFPFIYILSAN